MDGAEVGILVGCLVGIRVGRLVGEFVGLKVGGLLDGLLFVVGGGLEVVSLASMQCQLRQITVTNQTNFHLDLPLILILNKNVFECCLS